MDLHDRNILLNEGNFLIVSRGVEHRPNAAKEAWVMLFEPTGTLHTGNTENTFTQPNLKKI